MDIIIQSKGFKSSEHLDSLIQDKLGKLSHYTDKIIRANVTLFKGAETELSNNYCEVRLEMPGNDPFVKKNSSSFEHAVAECVSALHHMLEKNKEKELSNR